MTFDLQAHRRMRIRELEQRNEFLEHERVRYERLLAELLLISSRTAGCDPMVLLDAICFIADTNPARPASKEVEKTEVRAAA